MTEQEIIEEEEEEEKVVVDVTELNKSKKKKITPRVLKTIVHFRAVKSLPFKEVAEKVGKKYGIKLSEKEVCEAYDLETSKATVISEKGNKMFNRQIAEMEERFEDIWETVDRLHQASKKLMDEFEANSETEMQAYINFLKVSPHILAITREIKAQIEFIREQNSTYIKEQKNFIYSPIQIMTEVNKYLKVLAQENKIEIKSPDLAKQIKDGLKK
jgi:hypothetical protein